MKIPPVRLIIAGVVAVAADLLELLLFPVTAEGIFSPIADVLDIVVGGIMVSLLGWHWAFMPSIMGKLVPGMDLVPLWSLAVFYVAAGNKQATAEPLTGHASVLPPAIPGIPENLNLSMQQQHPSFAPHSPPVAQKELTVHAK